MRRDLQPGAGFAVPLFGATESRQAALFATAVPSASERPEKAPCPACGAVHTEPCRYTAQRLEIASPQVRYSRVAGDSVTSLHVDNSRKEPAMTTDYRELIATSDGWQSRPFMCDACGRPAMYGPEDDGLQHHAIAASIGCELIPAESRPDDKMHPAYVIAARAWSDRLTEEDRDRASLRMRSTVEEWRRQSVLGPRLTGDDLMCISAHIHDELGRLERSASIGADFNRLNRGAARVIGLNPLQYTEEQCFEIADMIAAAILDHAYAWDGAR